MFSGYFHRKLRKKSAPLKQICLLTLGKVNIDTDSTKNNKIKISFFSSLFLNQMLFSCPLFFFPACLIRRLLDFQAFDTQSGFEKQENIALIS